MNKSEFEQKISEASKPVIVDFWATWCAPCKMSKPILEKLAEEYAGSVEFMLVNADESREVLEQFKILGIPTVLTLRDGKEVGRVMGAQNEANYRTLFEAMANGTQVKVPLTPFNRLIRLGAGALLVMVGILTGSWLAAAAGGVLAFMGVYDRCPVWAALTGMLRRP
jgi:thioredoxin 1